jgi:hypothetical protein
MKTWSGFQPSVFSFALFNFAIQIIDNIDKNSEKRRYKLIKIDVIIPRQQPRNESRRMPNVDSHLSLICLLVDLFDDDC